MYFMAQTGSTWRISGGRSVPQTTSYWLLSLRRWHDERSKGDCFLTDMQASAYGGILPETFDEVPDYDWCRAEDINW